MAKNKVRDTDNSTINDGSHAIHKFTIGDFLIILILLVVGGLVAWFISSQNKKQVPRIPEYEEDEEIEDSEDDPTDSE